MYIHPDARLNGFKAVRIPKPAELFQILGPKQTNSHDGSNGSTWIEPENVNGVDNLDMINQAGKDLDLAARAAAVQSDSNSKAAYVEPKTTDVKDDDDTSPF